MVEIEFETPAKVALSVAREATTGSSGKDILKKYRELVAQKSSEGLLSKKFKHVSNACSDLDTKFDRDNLKKFGRNKEVQVSDKESRASQPNEEESQFPIYEDDVNNSIHQLDSQRENTNLIKHLIKESTKTPILRERVALKPRSINIPPIICGNICKAKPNAVDKANRYTPASAKNKIAQDDSCVLPSSALSDINVKSALRHMSNTSSSQKHIRRICQVSDTDLEGQADCASNEGSPQNFSTIEENESIWFMAETGSSPTMIANYESDNSSIDKDDDELLSTLHSSCTSIDSQNEAKRGTNEDFQESSFCESGIHARETFTPTVNSIQSFSADGRSFTTNSCPVDFLSPVAPTHNESMIVSECSTTETVSGGTVFPAENESYGIEQSEDHISGVTNHGSLKKDRSCLSDKIREDPDSYVSPASKAIAIGLVDSPQTILDSPEMFRLATASLIERNKTLVKEVRFVDQHCVELSERNASMSRDIQRLENNINDLKDDNESLHDAVVRSSRHSAKMEMSRDTAELKMGEQKDYVIELKMQVESLTHKLDESNDKKKCVQMELASSIGKYEILSKNNADARDNNSGLMERLAASQSTSELASASTAESYRDFCDGMHKKVEELQRLADERLTTMTKERHDRLIVEERLTELKNKYSEFSNGADKLSEQSTNEMFTPQKPTTELILPNRTPTSTVLAKTLQSELRRAHDITDRVVEAEKTVSITQIKLKAVTQELYASKADAQHFRALIQNCKCGGAHSLNKRETNDVACGEKEFSNKKLHPHSSLVKCIAQTRSECKENKKKFDVAMEQIKMIQHIMKRKNITHDLSDLTIRLNLLHALQRMTDVCTAINDNTDERAIIYSRHIFDHCGSNTCVREMSPSFHTEEQIDNSSSATSFVPISPKHISKYASTPSEIVFNSNPDEVISPVTAIKLSSSSKVYTPLKITQFREDILNLQSQLDIANDEKNAVAVALNHACDELETLTQMAQSKDEDAEIENNSNKMDEHYKYILSPMNKDASEENKLSIEDINSVRSVEYKPRHSKTKDHSLHDWQEMSRQESICLNNEVFHLREELRERNEDIHAMREHLEHVQQSKTLLEAQTVDLQKQLKIARQEIGQLGQKVPFMKEVHGRKEEIDTTDIVINSKSGTQIEIIKQLDDLKVCYISCQERLAEEVEHCSQLENVTKELKATIFSLEENLEEKSAQLSEANDKIDISSRKLSEAHLSDNNLNQQCRKLQDELTTLTSLRDDYNAECLRRKEVEYEVKELRADTKLASNKKEDIEQLLCFRNSEVDALKSEFKSVTSNWEAERKGHCDLMEQLQIDIECKTRELEASVQILLDNKEKLQIQTNISSEASEELKHLRSNYSIASKHICTIEDECAKLRLKQESMDRKSTKKREYIKKLTERCEEWKIFYQKQVSEFCETEKKYEDAKFMISNLTEEVQVLRKECLINDENKDNSMNQSTSSMCNECKYLRKAIARESSAVSHLKKDIAKKDIQINALTGKSKQPVLQSEDSQDSQIVPKSKRSKRSSFE